MEEERLIAYNIIHKTFSGRSLKEIFDSQTISLNRLKTNTVKKITYGTVRNKLLIDHLFQEATGQSITNASSKTRDNLRMSIYQMHFMKKKDYAVVNEAVEIAESADKRAKSFVNWALREFTRNRDKLTLPPGNNKKELSVRYSFPHHFIDYLIKHNGFEGAADLMQFYNSHYNAVIYNIKTRRTREPGDGYELTGDEYIIDPVYTDMFTMLEGRVESVLDCCAAPGGKSVLVKSLYPEASVTAVDRNPDRTALIDKNARRMNLNIETRVCDMLSLNLKKVFDLVIVDAPCTATGTIRKNPDVKYNYRKKIGPLRRLQTSLLEKADEFVKENGMIFYITCSIFSEENQEITEMFLQRHDNYKLQSEYFTFGNPHNGAYGAIIKKEEA